MIKELYQDFVVSITDGDPLGILIIVFVAFIVNYKKIIEFFDSRKKIKILKLEEALKNTDIKGIDRQLLQNELTKEYFKETLGIDVENELRHAIIKSHEKIKGELAFIHFQKALPYMKFQNNELSIEITKLDTLGYYTNMFLSIAFAGIGYILFVYGVFNLSYETALYVVGTSLFFIIIGFLLINQLQYISSAKKIAKKLEGLNND